MKYHLYTHDQERGTWMTARYEDNIVDAIKWGIDVVAAGRMENFTLCSEDSSGQFEFIPSIDDSRKYGDYQPWYLDYAAEKRILTGINKHYKKAKEKTYYRIEYSDCDGTLSAEKIRKMIADPALFDFPALQIVDFNGLDAESGRGAVYTTNDFNGGYGITAEDDEEADELRPQWKAEAEKLLIEWDKL